MDKSAKEDEAQKLPEVAQMAARMFVESVVESMFSKDSYGYRTNKSAIDAIETTRIRRGFVYTLKDGLKHLL